MVSYYFNKKIDIRSTNYNIDLINKQQIEILTKLSDYDGSLLYFFDKTIGNHFSTCICEFRKFVLSNEFLKLIYYITGYQNNESRELFCSRFKYCGFISTHIDVENVKLVFTYNITKNW
jgi:hypothetical protein